MRLRSTPIRARTRKLRTQWTADINQDLTAMYSVRAASQLVDVVDNYRESMRTIRVEKEKLLAIIKKNKADHRSAFEEAQKAYRALCIKELDAQLKAARSKGGQFSLLRLVQIEAPQDHTADYDRTIQMLEMSVDKIIDVDERQFQNYVQDIWEWSRDWASNSMRYVNKNSRHYGKISALANS